jgi:Family of unknown function (DUF5946)
MILCYHLQHPSLYSPAGLDEARQLLVEFAEYGASPAEVRQRNRARVDSSQRDWKITASATSHGSFDHPVVWHMTAVEVVTGGAECYCNNVRIWAKSISDALKATQSSS